MAKLSRKLELFNARTKVEQAEVNLQEEQNVGHSSLQSQQFNAWTSIAQAIKQGPSLPKVELMTFN